MSTAQGYLREAHPNVSVRDWLGSKHQLTDKPTPGRAVAVQALIAISSIKS